MVVRKFFWVNWKFLQPRGTPLVGLGGPRSETKFTKWSVNLKRLRTAYL